MVIDKYNWGFRILGVLDNNNDDEGTVVDLIGGRSVGGGGFGNCPRRRLRNE